MRRLRLLALLLLVGLAASGILGAGASSLAARLGPPLTLPASGSALSEPPQASPAPGALPPGGALGGLNRIEAAWAVAQWRILEAAARLARRYLEQAVVPRLEAGQASPPP